jgi:23S rRNA (cytosine1962-C5)-methyltransferase
MNQTPPCVVFEDEHLLVANKPPGWNTHAPSPYAGEGLYDWLRHREPRWAKLSILHRLDKETSGLIVFGKTAEANRSLTEQFTRREVRKNYLLVSDHRPRKESFSAVSFLVRTGATYTSRPSGNAGDRAETRFRLVNESGGKFHIEAEPVTGRTHQIRVHAAEHGFAILGDALYGGTHGPRVCLHAQQLAFKHPADGRPMEFSTPADFESDPRLLLRQAIVSPELTDAYRLIHGAADEWPGWYIDRLNGFLLSQSEEAPGPAQQQRLAALMHAHSLRGVYHKRLLRQVRQSSPEAVSPAPLLGETVAGEFAIAENRVRFLLSFQEGYSVGLFLDQRDNRRRLLTGHVAAEFELPKKGAVLNTFAYTCGFSVCAAKAGGRVTSLDLSKKYLEWGKRNFAENGMKAADHDFIFGDTFDWLGRFRKKQRAFDAVILDPPTFSQSKESGRFQAARDYSKLVEAALHVLRPGGVLFASTNMAGVMPADFLELVREGTRRAGRKVLQEFYVPQPPDFPISREEPGYLKTVWMRV